MLATLLHGLKGTPYIYQGEELGMTNVHFDSIDEYDDIETRNMYKDRIAKGYSHEEIMKSIYAKGRDNARTPMQWDDSENAGFTSGKPWLAVNENYKEINAKAAVEDENSIFHHYRKLIDIRKNNETIIYGEYRDLDVENPDVFAYIRELDGDKVVVICNFTDKIVTFKEESLEIDDSEVLLSNYKDERKLQNVMELRPYEAIMYRM